MKSEKLKMDEKYKIQNTKYKMQSKWEIPQDGWLA